MVNSVGNLNPATPGLDSGIALPEGTKPEPLPKNDREGIANASGAVTFHAEDGASAGVINDAVQLDARHEGGQNLVEITDRASGQKQSLADLIPAEQQSPYEHPLEDGSKVQANFTRDDAGKAQLTGARFENDGYATAFEFGGDNRVTARVEADGRESTQPAAAADKPAEASTEQLGQWQTEWDAAKQGDWYVEDFEAFVTGKTAELQGADPKAAVEKFYSDRWDKYTGSLPEALRPTEGEREWFMTKRMEKFETAAAASAPVGQPAVETPPMETPPAETPPAETVPAEAPAPDTPPVETPPVETPPVETPSEEPPAVETPATETPAAPAEPEVPAEPAVPTEPPVA